MDGHRAPVVSVCVRARFLAAFACQGWLLFTKCDIMSFVILEKPFIIEKP